MRPWRIAFIAFLFFISLAALAQTSSPDTVQQLSSRKRLFEPNPKRAALYGLIPGGGQIYNRRYWKLPIVYGAIGGLYYNASLNQKEYRRFRNAYQSELQGNPHEFSNLNLPANVLKNYRDLYRKNMEESYIFMSLTYLLSIAEAYVDAHLRNFDINEDLSGRIRPSWIVQGHQITPGLGVSLQWKSKTVSPADLVLP